jgi:hypothetical protein
MTKILEKQDLSFTPGILSENFAKFARMPDSQRPKPLSPLKP